MKSLVVVARAVANERPHMRERIRQKIYRRILFPCCDIIEQIRAPDSFPSALMQNQQTQNFSHTTVDAPKHCFEHEQMLAIGEHLVRLVDRDVGAPFVGKTIAYRFQRHVITVQAICVTRFILCDPF